MRLKKEKIWFNWFLKLIASNNFPSSCSITICAMKKMKDIMSSHTQEIK